MSQFFDNSIFTVDVEKISPNPFQPRREFDENRLKELSESIRQYGILQPLVVTRKEVETPEGGLNVTYEIISGERRWRAAQLAGLSQVPVIIRADANDDKIKLELAIIENLQREDLNVVERARAFKKLAEDFSFTHRQIAERINKSREYVANTIRILMLPDEMLDAVSQGKISEGHTRPLMMLHDRPEQQVTVFKEILLRRLTVRDSEAIARRIAYEKARKFDKMIDPELIEIEEKLSQKFGTRVHIEKRQVGGKLMIDFFSEADLRTFLEILDKNKDGVITKEEVDETKINEEVESDIQNEKFNAEASDDESYSLKNFSL